MNMQILVWFLLNDSNLERKIIQILHLGWVGSGVAVGHQPPNPNIRPWEILRANNLRMSLSFYNVFEIPNPKGKRMGLLGRGFEGGFCNSFWKRQDFSKMGNLLPHLHIRKKIWGKISGKNFKKEFWGKILGKEV